MNDCTRTCEAKNSQTEDLPVKGWSETNSIFDMEYLFLCTWKPTGEFLLLLPAIEFKDVSKRPKGQKQETFFSLQRPFLNSVTEFYATRIFYDFTEEKEICFCGKKTFQRHEGKMFFFQSSSNIIPQ